MTTSCAPLAPVKTRPASPEVLSLRADIATCTRRERRLWEAHYRFYAEAVRIQKTIPSGPYDRSNDPYADIRWASDQEIFKGNTCWVRAGFIEKKRRKLEAELAELEALETRMGREVVLW